VRERLDPKKDISPGEHHGVLLASLWRGAEHPTPRVARQA